MEKKWDSYMFNQGTLVLEGITLAKVVPVEDVG